MLADATKKRYVDSAGKAVPERMQTFLEQLEDEGFTVSLTPLTRPDTISRTFRIYWSAVYVAQWQESEMWSTSDPKVMLYRFPKKQLRTIAEAPASLTEEDFAQRHGVDRDHVYLYANGGKHYLHVRDEVTARALLQHWVDVIEKTLAPSLKGTLQEVSADIAQTLADPTLSVTERKDLVNARIGQGRFRSDLMREFSGRCVVGGINVSEALRASHIVPWRSSTSAERLDPKNGLLLSANLDALFDRYLITFNEEGKLMASPAMNNEQRDSLGLAGELSVPLCERRKTFMRRHAAEYDRRISAGGV